MRRALGPGFGCFDLRPRPGVPFEVLIKPGYGDRAREVLREAGRFDGPAAIITERRVINSDQERRRALRDLRKDQPDDVLVAIDGSYFINPDRTCPGVLVLVSRDTQDAETLDWVRAAERRYSEMLLRVARGPSGELL